MRRLKGVSLRVRSRNHETNSARQRACIRERPSIRTVVDSVTEIHLSRRRRKRSRGKRRKRRRIPSVVPRRGRQSPPSAVVSRSERLARRSFPARRRRRLPPSVLSLLPPPAPALSFGGTPAKPGSLRDDGKHGVDTSASTRYGAARRYASFRIANELK